MAQTKDFSILKWLVFPSLTLALAGVIAYFNVRVFGIEDGAPYVVVVGVLTAFSIAINKYISSSNIALARATFVFEIVLTLALALNAAYSFSVQREMSMARQSEVSRSADLKTISGLKSRTAQRDATRMIASGSSKSSQQIFADNEQPLFWIMVGELLAYIVAAFTLLALSHLWQPKEQSQTGTGKPIDVHYIGERGFVYLPDGRKRVTQSTYDPDEVGMIVDGDYEFPSSIDASEREVKRRPALRLSRQDSHQTATTVATVATVANASALKILREHLREIALDCPMKWFRADLIEGGVLIRMFTREKGREVTIAQTRQSAKLLAAVNRPDFRARLVDELINRGFPIEKGKVTQ